MGCEPAVNDAVGLEALRPALAAHGEEVVRIGDPALVETFRNLAATWQAAKGE